MTASVTLNGEMRGAKANPLSVASAILCSRVACMVALPLADFKVLLRTIIKLNKLSTPTLIIMPNKAVPNDKVG